ncbi:butyrate kinase 2 [Clostridium puniceum]|uniref:Probable butyrate kinase n=1 Tax=Clostridium puniceum TaxID=29367 RepID=A0A1S8TL85_9CLOT|nr:butyrate kinase [Clostridium puniceum]OOM78543.1 butyrate kinase 2 [Clostridium puniceum]
MHRILVINPGSTSTKIAIYDDNTPAFVESIEHTSEELKNYETIASQYDMRKNLIMDALEKHGIEKESLTAVAARGGLLPPVKSGAYEVNEDMVWQLTYAPQNEHASNLGAIIADSIGREINVPAYIYDPVTVDELEPIARITGLPGIERKGMGHNLNMRAAAMKYSQEVNKPYKELSLIVVHLGGGITMSLHKGGKMIDMISDDEGSFSPERAGGLPAYQVIKMATSGEEDYNALMKKVRTQGGLMGYFGVTDTRIVLGKAEQGDEKAALVGEAMAHNVAKNIGKLSVVVRGKVDAIILTGGIAYSEKFTNWIKERVEFISKVVVLPGENEMEALALGTLRVLKGEEKANVFKKQM